MGSLRARLHRVHRSSATSGALLLLATLSVLWFEGTSGGGPLVSRLRAPPVAATAAAAAVVQGPPCSPSLVVLLTSHKTGTAQAGCIKNLAVRSVHSADVYYNHVKSARAVSEYAADPLPGSGTCPPTAVFTCGDYLPILQDERCRRRPTCPCGPGGGISQCYSLEPGLLDIPGGASTTVIQVVRHPVDVILSAYFYHTQQPPPEEWIERVRMTGYGAEWYHEGAPAAELARFGGWSLEDGFEAARPGESYGSFLRRLPPADGVRLEFWRSARSLFGTARQYLSLSRQAAAPGAFKYLPLRFEDMQADFNATAGAMLDAIQERMPALDAAGLLAGPVQQKCNPAAWGPAEREANKAHVTAGRDLQLRDRLREVLLSDGAIAARLCHLCAALGYPQPPECTR